MISWFLWFHDVTIPEFPEKGYDRYDFTITCFYKVSFSLTTEAWLYPIDLGFNDFPETIQNAF